MSEEVKVDLASTADTSGFDKFTQSYNTLAAAKRDHTAANDLFVESERRVRTNLSNLVSGLSSAQDATQATASAIQHLSEVFQIGFAGTVIAGVVAALITQLGKVNEEVKTTTEDIKKEAQDLADLEDEINNVKRTPEEKHARTLQGDFDKNTDRLDDLQNPGFFHAVALGISDVFGGNMSATLAKQQGDEMANREKILHMMGENGAKAEDAKLDYHPIAGLGTEKAQNNSFEQAVVEANNQAEIEAKNQREAQEKGEADKRADEAAARVADHLAEEKEKQAAAESRADEKEDKADDRPERAERIKAHIIAGGQRSQGGGGGAYSVITRDPVVDEVRKQTSILTDIANYTKMTAQKKPSSDALAA